jgi:hypothetical protein
MENEKRKLVRRASNDDPRREIPEQRLPPETVRARYLGPAFLSNTLAVLPISQLSHLLPLLLEFFPSHCRIEKFSDPLRKVFSPIAKNLM